MDSGGVEMTEDNILARGTVKAVNISEKKGVVKTPLDSALLIADYGMEGDAHAGPWHRQISLLAQESVDKMTNQGAEGLCVGIFAENITTEGLELYTLPVGTRMQIGETLHEVTQIGKDCHTGCAIMKLVGNCVMPREGIFTKVLEGGRIKPGDEILVLK